MKNKLMLSLLFVSSLLTSCSNRILYIDGNKNIAYAVCSAIDYPTEKSNDTILVNVMLANRFYGKKYDGTTGLLIGSENEPGYRFESIGVLLKDNSETIIKEYEVDLLEYYKQENGIPMEKKDIQKNDFHMVYEFNLKNLFLNDYHNSVYFEVVYVIDESKEENHIFGRRYKFDFIKENENMKLSNFDFDFIN